MHLNLSADEVLSTTRAVRKRLDFERKVPRVVARRQAVLVRRALEMVVADVVGAALEQRGGDRPDRRGVGVDQTADFGDN